MSAGTGEVKKQLLTGKTIVRMLLGALLGAAMGAGIMELANHLRVPLKNAPWSDILGFWLGVTLFGVGLVCFGISFNRRELAESLEGAGARLPATAQEVRAFRLQAAALWLAGIMLLLPLLAQGSLLTQSGIAPAIFAAIVILFALQTLANIRLWQSCDEFLRQQMLTVCTITFAIAQGALFLWAAAEHLKLVPVISSWSLITVVLTLYVVVGSVIALRNRPASDS